MYDNNEFEKQRCFTEGVDAFIFGRVDNPYPKSENTHKYWQEGYDYSELCQTSLCTKVTFVDQGQGFLEWYINYGNIVMSTTA